MSKDCRTALAAALFALAAPLSLAQPASGPVESRLEARKVVRGEDGRETLADARSARPGDVIEYVATYRNTGAAPVSDLEATLPIPANTELLPGSARPAGARASVDSRDFAAPPLTRSVQRDGRTVQEDIPYREYRYLRWYPGVLAPRQSLSFRARVRVTDETR